MGRPATAYTEVAQRRIVVADGSREDGALVRHEMLHALLGTTAGDGPAAHPPAYFQGRCDGWVSCPPGGCLDAGPPPVAVPDAAPARLVSALDIRVDVTPAAASRTAADSWLTLVVSVTNPDAGPVWVPLELSPGQSDAATEVGGFGYSIMRMESEAPLEGVWGLLPRRRVPFGANQTRRFVIDVNAADFPAGDYTATGRYNTRTAATPFRVTP